MAVDRVVLEPQRRELGQEVLGEAGVDEEPQPRRRDGRATISLSSSSRMRSADTISRRGPRSRTAATSSGTGVEAVAGDEPGRAQHAQRVVVEADLRRQRRPQRRRGEVGRPAERVDQLGAGVDPRSPGRSSSAIAFTVKSRRLRSVSMSSANVTCGLRESSAYASARNVVISTVWCEPSPRTWRAPIVPNFSPWVQTASAHPSTQPLDLGRDGRRW